MDDIENNNENMPEEPEGSDDTITNDDNDSMMNYGGDYLDEAFNFDDDLYDWGDIEEVKKDLDYIKEKPTLISKFDEILKQINSEKDLEKKEKRIKGYKILLKEIVDTLRLNDKLNENEWNEEKINLEEREKFMWEQKINNVNSALHEFGVKLDSKDKSLYNYLNENLENLYTPGDKGEKNIKNINGYSYLGKRIIQRNKEGNFYGKDNKEFNNFLERMKKFTTNTARSRIIDIIGDDQNIESVAKDAIEELRKREEKIIRESKNYEDLVETRGEIENLEEDIKDLKENKSLDLNKRVLDGTLQGMFSKMKLWTKENRTTLGVGATSLLLSLISGLATSVPLLEKVKDAAKYGEKIGKGIEKFGKKIAKMGKDLNNILTNPIETLGTITSLSGVLINDIFNYILPILGIIIFFIIIMYINKWIGLF